MHIPDGMLDTKTLVAGWAVTVPAVGWAARRVRERLSDGRLVLMSVLAALIFALQLLNFPVAGGTSGHFAGGALAAILLGPWPAVLVMSAVLAVQAFFFADGGITALGANMVTLALVAPLVGWWVFSLAVRVRDSRVSRAAGAFAGAWAATVAAALAAAVMLWTSGAAPLLPVATAMAAWHAVIGLGEGLVTAGLVSYVHAVRPDLARPRADVMRPRWLAVSFAALALAAAGLSFLASSLPDGLETVARGLSFTSAGAPGRLPAPMPGYALPAVGNETAAGILAAAAGVIVTGALVAAGLRAMRHRGGRP